MTCLLNVKCPNNDTIIKINTTIYIIIIITVKYYILQY